MEMQACPCGKNFHLVESYSETAYQCEGCGNLFISAENLESVLSGLTRTYTMTDLEDLRVQCRGRIDALVAAVRSDARLYYDCPVCEKAMSRRAFASGSGIVVHQCPAHGTLGTFNWLRQAVQFIEKGGEVLVMKEELEAANAKVRELQNQRDLSSVRRRGNSPIFVG